MAEDDNDFEVEKIDNINQNNQSFGAWGNNNSYFNDRDDNDSAISKAGKVSGTTDAKTEPGVKTTTKTSKSDEIPAVKPDNTTLSRESKGDKPPDKSSSLEAFSNTWNGFKNNKTPGETKTNDIKQDDETQAQDSTNKPLEQKNDIKDDKTQAQDSTNKPPAQDTKETDANKDLKKIFDRLEGQKSLQKKMEDLKPEEKEAAGKAGLDAYKAAIAKGESEENALKKAEDSAGKKISAIARDNNNIKEINRRLDNNSELKNRIKDLDDASKSSVNKAAEDAYRKAKEEGAEDWKAVKAATEAGNEKSKEVRRDSDREKEIEKLSPEDKERVERIKHRAIADPQAEGKSAEELKKITDKAVDGQLNNLKREKGLEESISKMSDEQKENIRREMDKAYVGAAKQGKNDEECKKEATDRGKIVEKLDKSQSITKDMKPMSQEEKGSVYDAAHNSYRQEMGKSGDDKRAMQKAEDSAKKVSGDIQKDYSNIRDVKESFNNNNSTRNQMKGFDDKEKSSINKVSEDAYRKAKEAGENTSKAKDLAKEAGSERIKEIQRNHDRNKEIEKLDPAMRERVQGAMQQASEKAYLQGAGELEQERAAGKEGDAEIKDIANEQFVEKYKGKMSEADQKQLDKTQQEAYDKAISEGKSPNEAQREGTKAAMDKVEPSKALTPLPVPKNYSEKVKTFGEPGSHQKTVKMAAGKNGEMIDVTCNEKLAERMQTMFQELKDRGMSHLLKQDFGGCSYYRDTTNGNSLSNHSWGIAFDVNAGFPGNGYDNSYPTKDQDKLAEVFGKYGFRQLKHDRMHFEYCE